MTPAVSSPVLSWGHSKNPPRSAVSSASRWRSVSRSRNAVDAFDETLQERDRAEGVFAALSRFARSFAAWDARELDAR